MSIIERCHDRWANLHPGWRVLLVLAVLAGLGLAAGPPALGIYRNWRTGRTLDAAKEAAAQGRHADTRELALAVLRSDGTRQEAIPLLLHAAAALGDPRRVEVALSILASGSFEAADREAAWKVACDSAPAWMLYGVWTAMPESKAANPGFVAALFDRLMRDDMKSDAALMLSKVPAPLPPELDLRLMKLLVAKGTDEAFQEFQRTLIGRLPTLTFDSELVRLLDDVPQSALLPGMFRSLAAWQPSPADSSSALRLARCEMVAAPDRAEEIFAAQLAVHGAAAPIESARWCLQTRHLEKIPALLANLPPADPEAFRLRCLAAEQAADFKAWLEVLATPPADTPAAWVECERAHVTRALEDTKASDAAQESAFAAAKNATADDALILLARQAEARGLKDLAQRAWVEAIRRRSGPLPLSSSIKSIIERLATAKEEGPLLEVLTTYRLLEPGNPVILVQHDYLSCLNGRISPENLIAELTPVFDKLPDALPVKCVLALAHLLLNQPQQALELTDGENIDWFAASPAYRVIRGLALMRTGRTEEAAIFFEDFRWDDLLPSESRVLKGLFETAADSK